MAAIGWLAVGQVLIQGQKKRTSSHAGKHRGPLLTTFPYSRTLRALRSRQFIEWLRHGQPAGTGHGVG